MAGMESVTKEVRPQGGVVVGDDGSRDAAEALRYAAGEAARRGTTLHVVRSWSIVTAERPEDLPAGIVASLTELEASTRRATEERVAELLGDADVPVEVHVCHAPAVQTLLTASESADVLVVASRGRGGFSSLVLGSVAEQVVRHAHCPVVVVRGTR